MAKKSSSIRTTFNVLNIKLRQPDAKESTPKQYADLMMDLYIQKTKIKISPTLGAVMKRCLRQNVGKHEVIVGFITRFTIINGKWINLDNPDDENTSVDVPKNTAANAHDTGFYFTPHNHRLALVRNADSLPIVQAKTFFEHAIKEVIRTDQSVDVDIANSATLINKIIDSPSVSRLEITVSYTNNDLNDEFGQLIDSQMKNSNIEKSKIIAIAEKNSSIDIKQSPIVEGALSLARNNGTVDATVKSGNRKKKLNTLKQPRVETIVSDKDNVLRDVSAFLITNFPKDEISE